MPTQILATGSTAADSADIVVAAGEELTVALKGLGSSAAEVSLKLKDDAGAYQRVDELNSNRRALVLSAGTWRFTRTAGASCGVFSA